MEIKESLSLLLALLFIALSIIHIYWLLGGKWGVSVTFPTKENGDNLLQKTSGFPSKFATLVVALGLAFFALISLGLGSWFMFSIPYLGLTGWLIAAIFGLRAIGDFKYVGLFKKVRNTAFAQMDNKLYIPLSLCICISLIYLSI